MAIIGVRENYFPDNESKEYIVLLQTEFLELVNLIDSNLNVRIKTKFHRIAHHITKHLESFGCARARDIAENEEEQKLRKAG